MRKVDRNKAVMKARELRRSPSLPEGLLWQQLRARPEGFKFRRQHPIDARRDDWLREQGLRVIRFNAADVMKDMESAVMAILLATRGWLLLHRVSRGPPPQLCWGGT